jgi:hypothetical protein
VDRVRILWVAGALLALALVAWLVPPWAAGRAGARIHREAAARGLVASWQRARFGWDGRFALRAFTLTRQSDGDTVFDAESLAVALDPWRLLTGPRIREIQIAHAHAHLGRTPADADTLAPEPEPRNRRIDPRRAQRLRDTAALLARLALTPARQLPALTLRDVTLQAPLGAEGTPGGVRFDWLESRPESGGMRLAAVGAILGTRELPFEASLRHGSDDRVRAGWRVTYPDGGDGRPAEVMVVLDGAITQDRRHGVVTVHDTTRVTLGKIALRLGARVEQRGPRLVFDMTAADLTEQKLRESLPPAVLGPLLEIGVNGSWDYRLAFDLDLTQPDSVRFLADVLPHGLALDPERTRLRLLGLDQPFVAQIHLPHDRIVTRELSSVNPCYRPLDAIAPTLTSAVMANEDGGFFHHRGFNTEAVKAAIAENLKAGAFRRGAGTITMQLARNLYLGHERTISRKFREVVLAWILEHLAGVSKERLLEIYLNIIEWGPGVHGACEAARYYFDRDPADLTIDQSLFLATVVPAPTKWRYRFDAAGGLRPFERAQMHFIGRAMVTKGWLDPAALPSADSLRVELRGQARGVLFPDSVRADSIGAATPTMAPLDAGNPQVRLLRLRAPLPSRCNDAGIAGGWLGPTFYRSGRA